MDPSFIGQDDLSLYTNDMMSQDTDYFLSSSAPIAEVSSVPQPIATTTTRNTIDPSENITSTTTAINDSIIDATATTTTTTATNQLTFDKNEFSFLPHVQTIVQSILEGNNSDDIGKAVIRLNERIEQARLLLQDLPGLQYVKDEQESILHQETAILQEMKLKLKKYSHLAAFTNGKQ